jgi:predicted MFS family arabinose efflux permease
VLLSAWGGTQYEWASPQIIGLIVAGLASAVVFVFVELRVASPIIPMWLFRDRNFTLASIAGVCLSIGMFGVITYMPTYLQMTHRLTPTVAGLAMIPLMASMLVVGTTVGFVIARTGRYKVYPIAGMLIAAVGLVLLSTLTADAPLWRVMTDLAVFGVGLGMALQQLVLIVQNSFPVSLVGTATASNNYFRQVGGTLGMSLVGTLFTSRLVTNLQEGLAGVPGAADQAAHANSITPDIVAHLPQPVFDVVVTSYNDALVPLYLWIAPLALVGCVIACFIEPKPLATSNAPVERTVLEDEDAAV